jgi:hypothetical protein
VLKSLAVVSQIISEIGFLGFSDQVLGQKIVKLLTSINMQQKATGKVHRLSSAHYVRWRSNRGLNLFYIELIDPLVLIC